MEAPIAAIAAGNADVVESETLIAARGTKSVARLLAAAVVAPSLAVASGRV